MSRRRSSLHCSGPGGKPGPGPWPDPLLDDRSIIFWRSRADRIYTRSELKHAVSLCHATRAMTFCSAWRLTVIATSRAGYYEELDAVRNGTAQTMPAEEAIPDWPERLAAARA